MAADDLALSATSVLAACFTPTGVSIRRQSLDLHDDFALLPRGSCTQWEPFTSVTSAADTVWRRSRAIAVSGSAGELDVGRD